jgi:hypothetical protein
MKNRSSLARRKVSAEPQGPIGPGSNRRQWAGFISLFLAMLERSCYNHDMTKKKTPVDVNQLAKFIVGQAAKEPAELHPAEEMIKEKNAAAVALGRLGGLKGGKARAERLDPEYRKKIAKKAAMTRWTKVK